MRVFRPVLAVGFLTFTAGSVFAQERYASIDVHAGYTAPVGNTTKNTLKGRSSFGGGIAIALADRVHLGLMFDEAHHSLKPVIGGPNDLQYNIYHAFLKVLVDVVAARRWTVTLNAGPGLMFFTPNDLERAQTGNQGERHFAVNGGASVTWWFADRIGIVVSPQADIAFKKTGGHIFTTGSAMLFPLTGGFRFKL